MSEVQWRHAKLKINKVHPFVITLHKMQQQDKCKFFKKKFSFKTSIAIWFYYIMKNLLTKNECKKLSRSHLKISMHYYMMKIYYQNKCKGFQDLILRPHLYYDCIRYSNLVVQVLGSIIHDLPLFCSFTIFLIHPLRFILQVVRIHSDPFAQSIHEKDRP